MKVHQIYRQQALALPLEQAWAFFSSPLNLNQITPEFFQIEIKSDLPEQIYAGLLISYRMKAVWGIPMAWLSEVCHCQDLAYFVYQQREGPFKFWSHQVRLTLIPAGVLLEDIVFYTLPFGILGEIFHSLVIKKKLQAIFDTRRDYLQNQWPDKTNQA